MTKFFDFGTITLILLYNKHGALAQRERTSLAARGSSVQIRYAPPEYDNPNLVDVNGDGVGFFCYNANNYVNYAKGCMD